MKKLVLAVLSLIVMSGLTGCYIGGSYVYNADGTVTAERKVGYTKEELDGLELDAAGMTIEVMDGQEYFTQTEKDTVPMEEASNESVSFSEGIFHMNADESAKENGFALESLLGMLVEITVDFGEAVVDTNGTVLENGTKVCFKNPQGTIYAYTKTGRQRMEQDGTPPVVKGVKKGAYYKDIPCITVSDDVALGTVSINGVTGYSVMEEEDGNKTRYDYTVNGKSIIKKNKKNTVTAADVKGNKTTISFYFDTKAPTVKGVKNQRSYKGSADVYVRDSLSGIKNVKVNGKTVKGTAVCKGKYKNYKKYAIKKKGIKKIKVTDKAGNVKSLKIRIL